MTRYWEINRTVLWTRYMEDPKYSAKSSGVMATSHEHHGVSNYWHPDNLLNNLFEVTIKAILTLIISTLITSQKARKAGWVALSSLQWRHNEGGSVSNNQRLHCLLNCRISKKTSKLRITDLCVGNSPVTGEFPAQKASNAENVSIWWRHHNDATMW